VPRIRADWYRHVEEPNEAPLISQTWAEGKRQTVTSKSHSVPDETHGDLKADLAGALGNSQFFLVYQPTIDLQNNAFAGVEALLRWRHPSRGIISPEAFIPDLEANGDIIPVGRWILETACAQGAAWHDRGFRFTVSVNISMKQFGHDEFMIDVDEALVSSGFDPSLLVLEFPLSVITGDDETATGELNLLRNRGVRLAVDDFAPSHDTLATLESSPFSIVKLDRKFIADMTTSATAEPFVLQLVQLAKVHSLQIIASGVEEAEQRRRLQTDEVNVGQGFLFSKPHEVAELDRFLEDFSIFSGKPL